MRSKNILEMATEKSRVREVREEKSRKEKK